MKKKVSWLLFILMSSLAGGAISYLKISSLLAWQYSSDLFSYDQFLNELVFSGYPVDFTFGNLLGDHAYFFLFLLAPLKALLGDSHIYLLLLLNPFLFLGSALLLFSLLTRGTSSVNALLGGIAYLAGFGVFYRGLGEGIYGFHPDISAGFLLIGATCCFILPGDSATVKRGWNTAGILLAIVFILVKEETALIGLAYFTILFLLTQERKHVLLAGFSAVTTILGFWVINRYRTPYNRTNSTLIEIFFSRFREQGLSFLFHFSQGSHIWVWLYWVTILGALVIFHLILIKRRDIPPALIALFYCGVIKMGFSLLLFDFDLTTWHNLPGLAMIVSVLLLILSWNKHTRVSGLSWALAGSVTLSLLLFVSFDVRFAYQRYQDNKDRQEFIEKYKPQLKSLSSEIPENRIVSIPMFSPIEFLDHRFSFYPGGVFTRPQGVADYAIIPHNVSHIFTGNFENLYPIDSLARQFIQIRKTKNFYLYQRTSLSKDDEQARKAFLTEAGLTALIPLP